MLFYFDFVTWARLIRLVSLDPDRRRRRRRYAYLLLTIPSRALVHAVLFFLDGIVFPRLWHTQVKSPVFIIGHARSGTTLAHRLMCEDERFSAFKYYELMLPSLIEKKLVGAFAWLDRVALRGRLERRLQRWEERTFGPTRHIHAMGLTVPEEDDLVLYGSCASGFWATRMPTLGDLDFFHIDERPARSRRRLMRFYRECVRRQLHLNGGNLIHLSKNPTFCGRVESLIETFPDAKIVVLMRNPYETIPSLLKMLQTSWTLQGRDEALIAESLRILADQSFDTYEHPLAVLNRHPETLSCVVDYRDLVGDPATTMRRVYDELDLTLPAAVAAQIDASRGQGHETTHRYSLDEFGLDPQAIHTRLAGLFGQYDWDDEGEPAGVN